MNCLQVLILSFFVSLLAFNLCEAKGTVVIYWGTFNGEGSLRSACDTGNYGIVVLSFLDQFGNGRTPHLELAGHCQGNCRSVGEDVKHCQSRGVKVFLSLGGAEGKYGIVSEADAKAVAKYLFNNFLGGSTGSSSRPLGDAVLDGIDFDIELGGFEHYGDLAKELKRISSNKVLLSAAPQCPFPDQFVGPGRGSALETGLFDFVWVQFYNNVDCQYNPNKSLQNFFAAWDQWASISAGQVFLGLPASLSAATDKPSTKDGFMPPEVLLSQVLPRIKKSKKYGGVMLWSYFYDFFKRDGLKAPFSTIIKNAV